MTAELVGGPWCGKLAEIPPRVNEWHLPAPAFTRNPDVDLASDQDATLLYRRRGDSGKFDYVQTAAA